MSFIQQFSFSRDEGEPPEEHAQPAWVGPPEGELGVASPLNLVVGRSEQAVVALTQAASYSNGLLLSFVAQARELESRTARDLFHDQHPQDPREDDLPDGFLRLGVELPGGAKASNLGGRRAMLGEAEPEGPVFLQRGGRGGHGHRTRVSMDHDYWLWPLPQPGPIRVSCEWPIVGIGFSTVELDGAPLVAAAERVVPLWS